MISITERFLRKILHHVWERINIDMIVSKEEMYLYLKDIGEEEVTGNIFSGKTNISLISEYCSGELTLNRIQCRKCKVMWLCGGGCPNRRHSNNTYGE
jgi:uncharacterized protein